MMLPSIYSACPGVCRFSVAVFCLLLAVVGLSSAAPAAATRPLTIVTSFYPIHIATLNVAGGIPGVRVRRLAPPQTGCLHDYQLTPGDLKTIAGADVFVVNGGGMESFLDRALQTRPGLPVIDASAGLPLLRDDRGEPNPHAWLDPRLAARQAVTIGEGLAKLDPAHAAQYRAHAAAYAARLTALYTNMNAQLRGLPRRDIVTFHEAFPYFAAAFGLRIAAVIEREPGSEPSAAELVKTIRIIRASNLHALFAEPQYPPKAAEIIANETGARLYALDPAVTGPDTPDAYLQIMAANARTLAEALR